MGARVHFGSRADQCYETRLLRFTSPGFIILGDLGLRSLEGEEPIDIHEVSPPRGARA